MPSAVDFRLERPEGTEESSQDKPTQESTRGFVNRKTSLSGGLKRSGMVRDEKLFQYYKEYLQYSDEEAASNANLYPAIEVDMMSPDIRYNVEDYNHFGYVTKIQYKGQTLNQRLCPYCHNLVVPNAGKYDMLMISMIGDTNVGKSVYLTVLEEVLKTDKFRGNLSFMGTEEENELYHSNLEKLLNKRVALSATQRMKIPPMSFLYTYTTSDSQEKKYKLIVFCDIAGEDCRQERTMRQNGYHLAASDGFLFLIDVTRFPGVAHTIEQGSSIANMYQREIFNAINKFMIADTYENTTKIPAAVVLTKCDVLSEVGKICATEEYNDILNDRRGSDIHPGYVNVMEFNHLNQVVPDMIADLGERELANNVEDNFASYNYFVASALGKSPEVVEREESGKVVRENRVKGQIEPYRVAEPFYWLLAKNSCIPYYYYEILENNKGDQRRIEFFYYENEKGSLQNRIEGARKNQGINLRGFMNKWKIVEQAQI
jgi:hypothetical protein